ncbi:MAG: ABC transporter ATP-binding protein [Anaerolineae bacterium]|jgi:iron complex transport system ATP-binding protein
MRQQDNGAVLSAAGLSFCYNGSGRDVLRDLSLEVPSRAVTAILGPNGSGKTTLLRLLLGVLRPKVGTIRVAGRPQEGYSRRELSQLVGLVPQDEHIPFDFSILEYVLLGRAPYLHPLATPGEADTRLALDALRAVGLEGMQARPLPNLSGGERQLAVLARALAQQPRILLMDEPAAHLDLGNQGRLLDIIGELAAAGTTVVLTTHDANLASAIADYVVLMARGRIVEAGPADTVISAGTLSSTYGVPIEVGTLDGRRVVLLTNARIHPTKGGARGPH